MKVFVDTANLEEIEQALRRGVVSGITTNPSLIAKEPKGSFEKHVFEIIDRIRELQPGRDIHLSVEVFSKDPHNILDQARRFRDLFKYKHLSVKVPIGWDELFTVSKLNQEGFSVNCTCCMSVNQAVLAAAAGARYVSLFWGRIRDSGSKEKYPHLHVQLQKDGTLDTNDFCPIEVVSSVRDILDRSYPDTEIIVGSIRKATDVRDAGIVGAHIVTVPFKFLKQMVSHFKTDEVVDEFLTNFKNWLS